MPLPNPVPPPQIPPALVPSLVVNLMTADGAAALGAQWKTMEAKIVEGPALQGAMPGYKTSYDIAPHAGEAGFDDSAWPAIDAKARDLAAMSAHELGGRFIACALASAADKHFGAEREEFLSHALA